jgi:8-oxo-dGTP pyrophosphatase MutT (NUDIX family)
MSIILNKKQFIPQLRKAMTGYSPDQGFESNLEPFRKGSRTKKTINNTNYKKSAVLILVAYLQEDFYIILIQRSEYRGVHSGQIGLPGGRKEPSDNTLLETALRETHEEVGIQPEDIELLGQLSTLYIPPSNFLVQPFVGLFNKNVLPDHYSNEVKSVVLLPLKNLLQENYFMHGGVETHSYAVNIVVPYIPVDRHKIWGATSILLDEFRSILVS